MSTANVKLIQSWMCFVSCRLQTWRNCDSALWTLICNNRTMKPRIEHMANKKEINLNQLITDTRTAWLVNDILLKWECKRADCWPYEILLTSISLHWNASHRLQIRNWIFAVSNWHNIHSKLFQECCHRNVRNDSQRQIFSGSCKTQLEKLCNDFTLDTTKKKTDHQIFGQPKLIFVHCSI